MSTTGWRFLDVRPEAMSQDPIQQEFFAPEEGSPGALVREAVQNSLDAKDRDRKGPVVVRFRFGLNHATTYGGSEYFHLLRDHLQVQSLALLPSSAAPVSYLVVEDFGTRGLQGDPGHTIYDEQDASREDRNDFFYFWRNVGRSRKEEADRGRWGLGKTVFPASSTLSSFFGLTIRKSDGRALLMGQSVGMTHTLFSPAGEKVIYEPYGYYGRFESHTPLALPIEDQSTLRRFAENFELTRTEEAGLSIVVPYPQRELNPNALIREAIRSYYIPIMTGELVVEAQDTSNHIVVTAESLRDVIRAVPWRGTRTTAEAVVGLVDFAEKALKLEAELLYVLGPQTSRDAPETLKERIPEADLETQRGNFDSGQLLGFRVPILVKKPGGTAESHLDLFLQRDESLNSGAADFVREGLAITQTGKLPRQPVRGLALVQDKPLSTLLGDAENPAHTKWQELSQKIKEPKYIHGRNTVRLVNSSLQQLSDLLTFRPGIRDLNLLSEIFFLPAESEATQKSQQPRESDQGQVDPPTLPPPSPPKPFKLAQVKGGFRVDSTPGAADQLEGIVIRAAYAVRSGNPFTRYHPLDFDFESLALRGEGITVVEAIGNRLKVQITREQFAFSVSGFDERRDLEVSATAVYPAGGEES